MRGESLGTGLRSGGGGVPLNEVDGLGALMFAASAAEASTLCDSGASVYSEMQDAGPCPSPADSTAHNRADTLAGTNAEDARCHCENVRLIPPRS